LKPFKELTVLLQSHATTGYYGSIWETLPALELFLGHVEQANARLTVEDTSLAISINNCWLKLPKFYLETGNNHSVYAMATLLYPIFRTQYFQDH
jgi:hypothetical protein